MKREKDDAESNVADSRLGPSGNTPSGQAEVIDVEPAAQDADIKQEVEEAAVDRVNVGRMAEDIARDAAKFEPADSPLDAISSSSKSEDPPLECVFAKSVAAVKTPLSFAKKPTEKKTTNVLNYKGWSLTKLWMELNKELVLME